MDKKMLSVIVVVAIVIFATGMYFLLQPGDYFTIPPEIHINYPSDGATVSNLVMISGTAYVQNVEDSLNKVEIRIGDGVWKDAQGLEDWSFDWDTTIYDNGEYVVSARAWAGSVYSNVDKICIYVNNKDTDSTVHKWAFFVAACNFPEDDNKKLGNGGLYFAEDLSTYLINERGYPAEQVYILFDDGWIRSDNGKGEKIETLQERSYIHYVHYGGATVVNLEIIIQNIVDDANQYDDSEVFFWLFSHGIDNGVNILRTSEIYLWDGVIKDKELGSMLSSLKSEKTCIVVDACYAGGFADKTLFNFPTLMHSGIAKKGRIVMTGASKFSKGWADTKSGPLFSLLWFDGLKSGSADGYKPGLFKTGRATKLKLFKDGKVSVEEAFYYARCVLRSKDYSDYKGMQPQINDQYPCTTFLYNDKTQMFL